MKYLRWNLIFLAFIFIGCAYQPQLVQVSDLNQQSSATTKTSLTEKNVIASKTDNSFAEDDFLEDDFEETDKPAQDTDDFLEDDFGEENKEVQKERRVDIADPLAPLNKVMFHFNDKLYFWVLKPVAKGYKAVVPKPIRSGVKNFFHNLTTPIRLANSLFQGKVDEAGIEFGRFMVNSTWGVLGFGDPATKILELHPPADNEDLGQTLGSYGIGNGFYLVLPIMGPSTLRDSVGLVGDMFLAPLSYLEPTEAAWGIGAYEKINDTSFRIGDYEALKEAAISPYEAFRNAYIQYRQKKVEK